jgi:hypothetical protein
MADPIWVKRARRLRGALPIALRVGLALWLMVREALWLLVGQEPLALRLIAGGTVSLGAAIMLSWRWWLGGAALTVAGIAAAIGWHLAVGTTPWPLWAYVAAIAALVAWDAFCGARVARLLRNFDARRLAPGEFDHAAHLTVALDYVRRLGPDEALAKLRPGLQSLAERAGKPDGYHETRTRAWLALVTYVHRCHADDPLPRLLDRLLAHCRDGRLLERYYSRERLSSAESRLRFVPPDLAPLPHCERNVDA